MVWLSGALAFLSLLTVLKAPALPFFFAAVAATEWGHWLAAASIAVALLSWRLARRWGPSSSLATGASLLYLTPLLGALAVAKELPHQLDARFGPASPRAAIHAPARSRPIVLADLFKGVRSPPVRMTTLVYSAEPIPPLSLDLYQPLQTAQPSPGILVIHSGSWQSGDRREFQDLNRYLAARGYLVAAVDYRLAPRGIFPAQRDDIFSAIAYLQKHAEELGLEKERFVLIGRSAGGQIALSAAYAGKVPGIKGVIVFYAPNDLRWAYSIPANPLIMNSRRVIADYLGAGLERAPQAYAAASPLLFVNENTPPTLMIHGARDELVWALHEERLSKRLAEAKRPYFYLRLPWATHGCDSNFSGPCGQISTYAIERFLAAVLPATGQERLAARRNVSHV